MKKLCETIFANSISGSIILKTDGPKLTAGLKTPQDISQTENAKAETVNTMANP